MSSPDHRPASLEGSPSTRPGDATNLERGQLQPPYGIISDQLKEGLVIPFLGAGASLIGRGSEKWTPDRPLFLPSAGELADYLADDSGYPSEGEEVRNLAKIASYYVEVGGRDGLCSRLRRLLVQDFQYNALHEMLAAIPAPLVIVVTNYDTLLEQAFRARNRPFDLLVYPADREEIGDCILWWPHGAQRPEIIDNPNEFQVEFGNRPLIFKIHGTVVKESAEWDSFVITEEDYVDFLSRMVASTAIPALFYPYFQKRSFLFLGYSLGDWNLRVILKNLSRRLASRQYAHHADTAVSWAIQLHPTELERILWIRKNVRIFGMDLAEFVVRMRERLGV